MNKPIYLDYAAATPTSLKAVEVMLPCFTENFANPHAVHHALGEKAHDIVEEARTFVAQFIKIHPSEIIFTSGATESNNLAIQGIMRAFSRKGKKAPYYLLLNILTLTLFTGCPFSRFLRLKIQLKKQKN